MPIVQVGVRGSGRLVEWGRHDDARGRPGPNQQGMWCGATWNSIHDDLVAHREADGGPEQVI
jgi:hypothetical protein